MSEKPYYQNWVPNKVIYLGLVLAIVGIILLLLSILYLNINILMYLVLVVGLIIALFGIYLYQLASYAQKEFSREGGDKTWMMYHFVIDKLNWDGNGKLLDIGCGSGALTIECAKKWPEAEILGIDYWNGPWDYNKQICDDNARIEKVTNIEFRKGDATNLDYNEEFDAVVCNLVFNNVNGVKDKKVLIKEALSTLKKGGKFALHDEYLDKKQYGTTSDLDEFLNNLDLTDYTIESTVDSDFMTKKLQNPMIFNKTGIIYGVK